MTACATCKGEGIVWNYLNGVKVGPWKKCDACAGTGDDGFIVYTGEPLVSALNALTAAVVALTDVVRQTMLAESQPFAGETILEESDE